MSETTAGWQVTDEILVPPRDARAVKVAAGQRLRVASPKGKQACDFFTFNAADIGEWLSPSHSWVWNTFMRPREGQTFMSNRRNPILDFIEDGADGVHDMYLAPCDNARYRQLGSDQTVGCAELMVKAMGDLGYTVEIGPLDINLFTRTWVSEDQRLESEPNPVPPGAYVVFEALMDVVCVATSCPWELKEPWPINVAGGITEIEMQVLTK